MNFCLKNIHCTVKSLRDKCLITRIQFRAYLPPFKNNTDCNINKTMSKKKKKNKYTKNSNNSNDFKGFF